jgi:hypothetical protein
MNLNNKKWIVSPWGHPLTVGEKGWHTACYIYQVITEP